MGIQLSGPFFSICAFVYFRHIKKYDEFLKGQKLQKYRMRE